MKQVYWINVYQHNVRPNEHYVGAYKASSRLESIELAEANLPSIKLIGRLKVTLK